MDIIDGVLENAKDDDLEDAIKLVKKYKEKYFCRFSEQKQASYNYMPYYKRQRCPFNGKQNFMAL